MSLIYLLDFGDQVEVMGSLRMPLKISIKGSDGNTYTFLYKSDDDLRKDVRMMTLFNVVNRLLSADSEARKRQLRAL
jgi:serine/threonine-protein kinase ATR